MLLVLGFTYCSCLAFSISMKRHFHQLFSSQRLTARKTFILRSFGWLLLILSGWVCAQLYGVATGLVLLCGLFSAVAFLIALLLHYSPRIIVGIGFSLFFLILIIPII